MWDGEGVHPVRPYEAESRQHAITAKLAIDAKTDTEWIGSRQADPAWIVKFGRPLRISGVYFDSGNELRRKAMLSSYRIMVDGEVIHPRFLARAREVFITYHHFDLPLRAATSLTIALGGEQPSHLSEWALRDVRFLTDQPFVFDAERYFALLPDVWLPLALAILWVGFLVWTRGRAWLRLPTFPPGDRAPS